MAKLTPAQAAKIIRDQAAMRAVQVRAHDGIVTAFAMFTPGDEAALSSIKHDLDKVLDHVLITRPGSRWGCDGVGFFAALDQGIASVNVSGADKRLCKLLAA